MRLERSLVINMKKNKSLYKRQTCRPGDVLAIMLPIGKYMYLRELKESTSFSDFITDDLIDDVNILKDKKILFSVGVYRDVLNSGVWPKIGKIPFQKEEEMWGGIECVYDVIGEKFQFYFKGQIYGNPSAKDCYNLEFVAAWDRGNIEERLMHYIKTGKDHPRIWDRWSLPVSDLKKAWGELYDEKILINVKELVEKAEKEKRYQ